MAFLFKSKKNHDRALSSRDGNAPPQGGIGAGSGRMARDEKNMSQHRATPTGSMNSIENERNGVSSPEYGHSRRGGSTDQIMSSPQADLAIRSSPTQNPNASLYPWSQRRLSYTTSHPSPFPRYGAAVNAASSKEGDIYMMGGLINSSTVKGDLWMIEAGGNMACYPLATTAEGPGPRVGHASLLVGNAFIVYGGDTKIDDSDVLDETLYLLNTSTRHWSRALPSGPRPSGRYGHSLNILGSKIYIFGGQVEGYFMNDLAAFDLNQLQMANNRWEILIKSEASPAIPAARTNHTIVTYNDKLYLFGGTNGFQWFNDVWCYDPAVNKWSQLDCIGYIPSAREGHAAALVDDVMYVFGGRTEEGTDLGDLAAFRISLRRWYTFQNMGPSPSPRSGHSMTTVGKSVVVLGGEPSSTTASTNDLGLLYVLDTTKIRYPIDGAQNSLRNVSGSRRPSIGEKSPNDGSIQESRRLMSSPTPASSSPPNNSMRKISDGMDAAVAPAINGIRSTPVGPAGPPPQGPTPAKPTEAALAARAANGPVSTNPSTSPQINQSPVLGSLPEETAVKIEPVSRHTRQGSALDASEPPSRAAPGRPSSPPAPTRQLSNSMNRRSSGRNSQTVALLKELDASRNKNAWYASELELARRNGFSPNAGAGPSLDKSAESFDDEDRPLIEALIAMKTELANVQSAVDKQAVVAARQIAEAEKQRDAAIQEALYAKAKYAAHGGGSTASTPQLDGEVDDAERSQDVNKKFASALHVQKSLQTQLDTLKAELASEKRARQLADETLSASEQRMTELENYKQTTSADFERVKSDLHLSQREARDHSSNAAEAVAALALLKVEKDELHSKYREVTDGPQEHKDTFASLHTALKASDDARTHMETKLAEERTAREAAEEQLSKLKVEHEARGTELESSTKRLRDAEELAEKHANEAQTHRAAVLSGLDKIAARDVTNVNSGDAERVVALQNQVNTANALAKKYQLELDGAADKLRSAEERIAGLEQYQEQSSREGVSIRRQLQTALREAQGLQASHTDVKNQLAAQQLEANAITVQHNALKDILAERGISPSGAVRARGASASPRTNSPELTRMRDLESQLAAAHAAHEDTKQSFAGQAQESESAYREKLTQLESDYQSAVHYVKGTEKMLKQLKDQLNRYKTDNARLKTEVEELEQKADESAKSVDASKEWETERTTLQKKVDSLQEELKTSGSALETKLAAVTAELAESKRQKDLAAKDHQAISAKAKSQDKDLEQLRSENGLLEKRATDAEQKVALLLDQVENSVDNYRRQSRQVPGTVDVTNGAASHGHSNISRKDSVESAYGSNGGIDGRNSMALDNLASELETLRSHWEATNKNYRMSTNFDFDAPDAKHEEAGSHGLSESLADWRKKLDADEKTDSKASK